MSYDTILLDIAEGVATITLNRPERLNSFTEKMHADLRSALDKIEKSPEVRALVITGAGRGFCAGQDLAEATHTGDPKDFDAGATLEKNYNVMLHRLRALPYPVICAVNGIAAGAGANVALACDIVIAARSASFLQAFAKIGLIPDAGGTYTLTHRIGLARALALSLTAEPLPAEQAAQWGLIWKCVDDNQLAEETRTLAKKFATGPTRAYQLIKQAIYAAPSNTFDQQLQLEVKLQTEAGRTHDFVEGVKAFLEKRAPKYLGK